MSTRAQIKFKDSEFNIHIYKHSDGYPEGKHGVLAILAPFVEKFFENRGNDECYFLAQFIRHTAVAEYQKELTDKPLVSLRGSPYGTSGFLGWGLDCVKHGDTEYLYEIGPKGEIYVNGKRLSKAQITKAVSK